MRLSSDCGTAETCTLAPATTPSRGPRGFRVGDNVTFDDDKGKALVGIVTRLNRRTAGIGTTDGRRWRLDFQLLRHVLDV